MPMTPDSATTPYCTAAQAVQFFDPSIWGDLLSDTKTRLTSAQVQANPILTQELLAASGEVEEAVLCGGRYSPTDLAALQAAGTAGGTHLAKMVATLAFWNATERRYPKTEMPSRVMRIFDSLDRLRTGEAIFGFIEVQEAGNAATQMFYPTLTELEESPVYQNRRMFGNRHLETY